MPLDFSLGGKVYDPVDAAADAGAIERYAAAVGNPNPRYVAGPGQIAPPLFPVVFGFPLMMMMTADPDLGVGNPLMILHGEQEHVFHRPLRGGESLVLHPVLEQVEDKGPNAVFVSAIRATTPDEEPVVDQFWTIFVRGGGSGAERPKAEPAPAPEPGPVAAEFTRLVDEAMPARYADASGDHNPIHLDPEAARSVGLPGVINHGLGTCALVAGGLVDALLHGDGGRVRRLSARFTGMVTPGEEVATVAREDGPGRWTFETARPDGAVVMTGALDRGEA
ncbi:MAG: MaoC family dehydratase N-terminal domain-containing protein [Actinobacteria bacterium]|nr:MaoC family dehydratase N-terminal domain-containing protein [Actinomycetota bacterium]